MLILVIEFHREDFLKKIFFLSAFLFICFSCKNPFEKTIDKNAISVENNENSNNSGKKVNANFSLGIKQNDILLKYQKEGAKIYLQSAEDYDSYEWYLGAKKLSDKKVCEADFTGAAKNEYPVMLYAKKAGIVYSSLFFVCFDGENITENHSRTILPAFLNNSFVDILITLTNIDTQEVITKIYENYEMFEKEDFVFEEGNYKVIVNAKIGDTNFVGETEKKFSKYDSVFSVLLSPIAFDEKSEKYGSLEFKVFFAAELLLSDVKFSLYKKDENRFSLYYSESVKNENFLLCDERNEYKGFFYIQGVFDKIKVGTYWLRIDGIACNGKKACYQAEYVYIVEGLKSEKNIKLCDFYDLYKIDYDFNEGFFVGDDLVEKYSSFDTFCLPDDDEMFKVGYDFAGWYFDENFVQKADNFHNYGDNTCDLKLYAKWKKSDNQNSALLFEFLEKCEFKTIETENSIKIEIPLVTKSIDFVAQKVDLFVFNIYDKNNKNVALSFCTVDLKNENIVCEISAKLTENEFYMIKVSAFKTSNKFNGTEFKEKIFCDKQIIKPSNNYNQ